MLGPVDPREIPEVIDQIEAEGCHFVPAPPIKANWPVRTDDPSFQIDPDHDPDECHK